MRVNNKQVVKITIILLLIISCIIILNRNKSEEVKLDEVILKNEIDKSFAMYVGKDNNYEEYEGNTFPKGYRLNTSESKCIDNNGTEVNNALKEENGSITLTTNKSSYCYLYFDEKENLSNICNESTMQECMNNKDIITTIANLNSGQAGLYRYQGTIDLVDNNYICFGTSDKETCLNDTDHYMYRILGITDEGKLKLIKNTPIKEGNTTTFQWHNTNQEKTIWGDSDLFKRLNGIHESKSNIFINSNEYPYLKEEEWLNKIEDSNWYQGFSRGGIISPLDAYQVYQMENGERDTNYGDLEDGQVKYVTERFSLLTNVKIGLMNMTDYNYALKKDGYNCYGAGLACSQNWLHIFGKTNYIENIMNSYGYMVRYLKFCDWGIYHNYYETDAGYIMDAGTALKIVRPVFYLENTINITGLGTIDNPYII